MLEVRGASFGYPDRGLLFGDLDLAVRPGERIAIVGRNGSGKSTLLRCLAGISPWSSGSMRIDGHDPSLAGGRAAALALIGYLFESPDEQALAPTVEREIAFGLENRGIERSRMRSLVDDAMGRFGLSNLAERHPSSLSGGERQRLALASVLVEMPRYLFLDEPTSRLDAAGRRTLQHRLDSLSPRPAIVEVTLRWEQVEKADRVLLVSGGRVREVPRASGDLESAALVREAVPVAPAVSGAASRPPSAPLLRAERLAFAPPGGAGPVFSDVSLEVRSGEALILTGPTGSGKTTLLRMLAGFRSPDSGTVSAESDSPSRIAYMPQFAERLLFAPTVLEDVAFGAIRSGASRSKAFRQAGRSLAAVQVDAERTGPLFPGDLSCGERRRVALAGLLSAAPGVLLLDEPEVGLDGEGRSVLTRILSGLLEKGVGIAVATHETEWLAGVPGKTVALDRTGGSRTVAAA